MFKGEQYTFKWVILTSSCIVSGLTWGLLFSVGIIYSSWVRYFDAPAKFISLTGGLPISLGCMGGPVFGIIINKIGFRRAGLLGGTIMAFGMISSSFCESIVTLAITFGVITGFGAGLVNLSGCAALNDYFLQSRAFAEGVSGSGLCIGTFVISTLQMRLVQDYKWQGAILITGALCLHNVLASLFFVPLEKISNHPLNLWKNKDERRYINKNVEDNLELKAIKESCVVLADAEQKKTKDKSFKGILKRSCLLWRNYIFLLILTSDFLSWLAIFVPYIHLVERARLEGVDENTASWLSSTIGLAGIVGRPATGYLCDKFRLSPFWCYCAIQMLVGVSLICSSFSSNIYALFIFAVCFGLLGNGYGLIKASAAILLGPENFVDAFSWMLLFEGTGICLGPFIAGWIYDITQSYTWSFRFSGFVLLISASLCFLKRIAENAERIKKTKRKNQDMLVFS